MMLRNLPVENPKPDGKRFIGILEGSVRGARTPRRTAISLSLATNSSGRHLKTQGSQRIITEVL